MSHGPYLVDHNIFGSKVSLESWSQGGAYVNNLVCGTVWLRPVPERPTPYHSPHSTQVAGYAAIHGGDDRHIGNIFLGGDAALAYGPTSEPAPAPVTARPATTATRARWRSTAYSSPTRPEATTSASRT